MQKIRREKDDQLTKVMALDWSDLVDGVKEMERVPQDPPDVDVMNTNQSKNTRL